MVWVAPNSFANCSLWSSRSTAMMGSAPAAAAAASADRPTPPTPNTATDWPGSTFAVCSTGGGNGDDRGSAACERLAGRREAIGAPRTCAHLHPLAPARP